MTMKILSAKPVIESIHASVKERVQKLTAKTGHPPKLSVVLVGEDPASVIYTRKKGETAVQLGMDHETIKFPADAPVEVVRKKIEELNRDPRVSGILIQRPLPKAYNEEEVLHWITPSKDVDAFHPENVGRLVLGLPCFAPCTPAGVLRLLDFYKIDLKGKVACVIGRSSIVGKPMASLLLARDCTVLQAHSRTVDLPAMTRQADIVVVAAGKPGLIGREHIRKGAVVVDVGIHRNAEGKVVGDVRAAEMEDHASAMTPVPGGVGPMTIAVLMENTVLAAGGRPLSV